MPAECAVHASSAYAWHTNHWCTWLDLLESATLYNDCTRTLRNSITL